MRIMWCLSERSRFRHTFRQTVLLWVPSLVVLGDKNFSLFTLRIRLSMKPKLGLFSVTFLDADDQSNSQCEKFSFTPFWTAPSSQIKVAQRIGGRSSLYHIVTKRISTAKMMFTKIILREFLEFLGATNEISFFRVLKWVPIYVRNGTEFLRV